MSNIGKYTKAILAFFVPGLIALGAALLQGSDGGQGVTGVEWVQIALACLVTSGVVFVAPNAVRSDPNVTVHVVDPDGDQPVL